MRYFVQFSYHGQRYHGWQSQPNAITVQEVLQQAMTLILKQEVLLVGAGRTDAGVHAREMYAHFDLVGAHTIPELEYRLNAFLPEDIAVQRVFRVPETAHARFDALERTYEYWVVEAKNPFYTEGAYYVKHPLNMPEMNAAALKLVGCKDFECFSKAHTDVKTYICDIRKARWRREGEKLVFTITADRFLRNMVRAIVGTLLDVGWGKMGVEDIPLILESRDRAKAGASVPAKGLYLKTIKYPENIIAYHG